MIVVFHHCGLSIISNMEFLYSWVTNLYICIAQLENTPIKSISYTTYSVHLFRVGFGSTLISAWVQVQLTKPTLLSARWWAACVCNPPGGRGSALSSGQWPVEELVVAPVSGGVEWVWAQPVDQRASCATSVTLRPSARPLKSPPRHRVWAP